MEVISTFVDERNFIIGEALGIIRQGGLEIGDWKDWKD